MIDFRRLQRSLFRLQLDENLAQAFFAGDSDATASLVLGPLEIDLLRAAGLSAVTADLGGRRRTQVLGNASSEFSLTLTVAAELDQDFLQAFARSREFHAAIAQDKKLPFAFAAYARRLAHSHSDELLAALIDLEEALARARRAPRRINSTTKAENCDLCLAPGTELLPLPLGLFRFAEESRVALDTGTALGPRPSIAKNGQEEWILIVPKGPSSPHALSDVYAECLQPPADKLLRRIAGATPEAPFDAQARADFARQEGATPDDLDGFLEEMIQADLVRRS